MRILTINLLAVALLLMGAASASAFGLSASVRDGNPGLSSYTVSDFIIVDVFLDTEGGLTLLSASVTVDSSVFSYDGGNSTNIPVIYPAPTAGYGTNGNQPGYILYTGGMSASIMYPQQNPFTTWPAPPPGQTQVNINYAEPAFKATAATGTGIWIASLLFHVDAAFESSDITLSLSNGGNTFCVGGTPCTDIKSQVSLTAPITVTGHLPEPTTATLIGLGLLGLGLAGRRKA